MPNPPRDRNARRVPYSGGQEESLLCDPGSELRPAREQEKRRAKIIDGDGKIKNKKKTTNKTTNAVRLIVSIA